MTTNPMVTLNRAVAAAMVAGRPRGSRCSTESPMGWPASTASARSGRGWLGGRDVVLSPAA